MNEEIVKSQTQSQDKINKFIYANDIIELTYQTRMSVLKALVYKDSEIIMDGTKNFEAINKKLDELQSITKDDVNLKRIDSIRKSSVDYKKGMEKMVSQWNALTGAKSNKKTLDNSIKELTEIASAYLQNCNDFLTFQKDAMISDIKDSFATITDRKNKITKVNDISSYGNEIRVATWKAQVLRDPKIIETAQQNFEIMNKGLDELKAITLQEANLKLIELNRTTIGNLKTALGNLLQNWQGLQALTLQRETESNQVLDLSKQAAETG